jgi:hypothetical protein
MSFVIPKKKTADGSEGEPMDKTEPQAEAKDGDGSTSASHKKQAPKRKSGSNKDINAPKKPSRYAYNNRVIVVRISVPWNTHISDIF